MQKFNSGNRTVMVSSELSSATAAVVKEYKAIEDIQSQVQTFDKRTRHLNLTQNSSNTASGSNITGNNDLVNKENITQKTHTHKAISRKIMHTTAN